MHANNHVIVITLLWLCAEVTHVIWPMPLTQLYRSIIPMQHDVSHGRYVAGL